MEDDTIIWVQQSVEVNGVQQVREVNQALVVRTSRFSILMSFVGFTNTTPKCKNQFPFRFYMDAHACDEATSMLMGYIWLENYCCFVWEIIFTGRF